MTMRKQTPMTANRARVDAGAWRARTVASYAGVSVITIKPGTGMFTHLSDTRRPKESSP